MLKITSVYCFVQISIFYLKIGVTNAILGKADLAGPDDFPFIVSLSYTSKIPDKQNHFCGGALISNRHVLTAAHCIEDHSLTDEVMVVVGTINFKSGQTYRVHSWITYDDWASLHDRKLPASNNDIAIVTLSREVENIAPAKVSELKDSEVMGEDVVVAGWGVIDYEEDIVPDSLLKVNLKVLDTIKARQNYHKLCRKVVEPKPHCYYTTSHAPAVLSCGDSGGPLLLLSTKEIVGINKAACNIKNPLSNPYAMSKHLKLLDEYKEFIEDVKNSE